MWKHVRNLTLLIIVILVIAGYFLTRPDVAGLSLEATTGREPELTELRQEYFPTVHVAEASGWPDDAAPTAARGLTVSRFAAGLNHPRSMLVLPNGDVLVAETNSPPRDLSGIQGWIMGYLMDKVGAGDPSPNRIVLLRDGDGDGVAEKRTVLREEGLNSPFGMVLVGDKLYIANTDAIFEFPFTPGQTKLTGKGRRVANLNDDAPNNHWTRNLLADPKGEYLYVAVGSNSNIAEHGLESEEERARILRIELATNKQTTYAAGLRNPVGMDWNPVNGELWTVVNERDMLGSDMVPDYLTEVEEGVHFGWPWHFWGGYIDPRVEPKNLDHRQYERRPDYALGAHVAALGLEFVPENNLLNGDWAGDAIVARHGSWNRVPLAGYDVVRIAFDERGKPVGKPLGILTGFVNGKEGIAMGRPTMVTFAQDGALLVSDDVGGVIWRVAGPAN